MPIANKRVAVLGIKAAQKAWDLYSRKRVDAERSAKDLAREFQETSVELERLKAELARG